MTFNLPEKKFRQLAPGSRFVQVVAVIQTGEPGAKLLLKIPEVDDGTGKVNAVAVYSGHLTRVMEEEPVIRIL